MPGVPCDDVPTTPPPVPDPDRLAACADELLQRLRAARQPVLMVGVEVRRYGLEARVAELARRLNIPVVTSFMGRGLLAETDAPLRGTYLGLAGEPALSAEVETSDALLLLGVIVSDTNFAVSAQRIDLRHAIQALEGRVVMGHHVYPDVPLAALIDVLLERVPLPAGARGEPARRAPPAPLVADDGAVTPQDIAAAVNDLLRAQGPMPLACDVGDCLFTAMDIGPTALVAPGYYATMGYGVPAGLGLQAATGQRAIVLVGDGAFQMTGWELGNAARHGLDPIVLVFNNAGWEMLRAFEPGMAFNELGTWDFAAMAAGMGGDGHLVRTRAQLRTALRTRVRDTRAVSAARHPSAARRAVCDAGAFRASGASARESRLSAGADSPRKVCASRSSRHGLAGAAGITGGFPRMPARLHGIKRRLRIIDAWSLSTCPCSRPRPWCSRVC